MDQAQNPYQAPSVAAAQELGLAHTPDGEVFARYLTANRIVSSLFIAIGFGGLLIVMTVLFSGRGALGAIPLWIVLAVLLLLGVTGIYQRQHNVVAMIVTAALSTLLVMMFMAAIPFGIMRAAFAGQTNWGAALGTTLFICALSWLFITPLRLLIQAWRWRQLGVDLAAFEKEINRRA